MHKCLWSKLLLSAATILALAPLLAAESRQIILSESPGQTTLLSSGDHGFEVRYAVPELKIREVMTKAGLFEELYIEGMGFSTEVGEPKLPLDRRLISVPVGARVRFTILDHTERILESPDNQLKHRIIPAQEPLSKSADPDTVPFLINDAAYSRQGFDTRQQIQLSDLGYLRGVRVFALDVYPVRYDPGQNRVSVIEDLTLRVDFLDPDLEATAELRAKTASYEFEAAYGRTFFNWQGGDRSSLVRYPTKMLILCPPAYVATLQPFVDWKRQQGYEVAVTTVGPGANVANSVSALNSYMAGVWSAATPEAPAPTYLLIVGDTSTSGNNIIAPTGNTGSHPTDLTYVRLQGTDYLPEMYFGRFSVSSAAELTNIINKTLMFEQTTMPDMSYLGQVIMIAGADASHAPTYGNGQINYGTTHYFNQDHGITSDTYLYPASASSDALIIANANAGRGYINYTAHGSQTSWADPTFTVNDLNAMTNVNKYFVAVGNCCLTNQFTANVCFGEAVIRAANKAGVAYIGGTNSTYWNEDYWWAIGYKTPIQAAAHPYNASTLGAYDAMFHTHGEAFVDWGTTVAEATFMGNKAVAQSGSSMANYYWEIYSIMGDPSLMPYFGVPTVNNATYPSEILIGVSSIAVTAQPWSRVALTFDGELCATGIVPASGSLTLDFIPFDRTGIANLVITAQNKITIRADVTIIPNSGAYLTMGPVSYSDGGNNIPEYGDNGELTVTFANVGSLPAENVVSTLSCPTPGITITDSVENIALLAAAATLQINGAFAFGIDSGIADGTEAVFTITSVCDGDSWSYEFSLLVNAPQLGFGVLSVSDPSPGNNNGRLDPGETVTVQIALSNTGAAISQAGTATFSSSTAGITIHNPLLDFSPIAAGGLVNLSFSVTASETMMGGSQATFEFSAQTPTHSAASSQIVQIGDGIVIGSESMITGAENPAPINIFYQSLHGQAVYTRSELNAAGISGPIYIGQLGFYVVSAPSQPLPNFIIRMKHTTDSNAAFWQSADDLVTVWSSPSYLPLAGGYDKLTLSTPFLWNGIDNIVIDTAFGLIGSGSATGTVQYSPVANGFRYARSNTGDMTNVFSGSTVSSQRPNLMLVFEPLQLEPVSALTLTHSPAGALLQWEAVPNAAAYEIYRSPEPDGSFVFLAATADLNWLDSEQLGRAFYYVKAVSGLPTRK